MHELEESSPPTGWVAELQLEFTHVEKRTILSRRRHQGPLQVQRPFYPEKNGACHVYLLHPPGGIVMGDYLNININVGKGAHAFITTPAAGKYYRGNNKQAIQKQLLRVQPGAVLEWFPLESIIYSGANIDINTRIELMPGSHFFGWDIVCLGRPACDETFSSGRLIQHMEIWRENSPIRLDHLLVEGSAPILKAPWGLDGKPIVGTLICTVPPETELKGTLAQIRSLEVHKNEFFSCTHIDNAIICRYLGHQTERAKEIFIQAWKILRHTIIKEEAVIPRAWLT